LNNLPKELYTLKKYYSKIKNFIYKNPIKSISIFTTIIGGIYLFYFLYFKVKYLPLSSLSNLSILIIIYALLATLISFILVFILIFPAQQAYDNSKDILKNNKNKIKKSFIIYNKLKTSKKFHTLKQIKKIKIINQIKLIMFKIFIFFMTLLYIFLFTIGLFYPIISKTFNKINNNLLLFLTVFFIGLINYFYYKLKKFHKEHYFLIIIYLIIIFIFINFLSSLISKTLRIGNYHSTLIINNKIICKTLKNLNKKNCKINANILWRTNEEYIIKYKDKTYKIPAQYIFMECFSNKNSKN
jgi:hypothetical protein